MRCLEARAQRATFKRAEANEKRSHENGFVRASGVLFAFPFDYCYLHPSIVNRQYAEQRMRLPLKKCIATYARMHMGGKAPHVLVQHAQRRFIVFHAR